MIAYKGMCPGMVCLGYQLKMGLNVTEEANCQANGFHCAANPMDCLRYYGDFQNSEYYLVRPCGDLDEDAVDSRISCTQLWVLRKLEPQEFFLHALAYMADHPQMPDGCDVNELTQLQGVVLSTGGGAVMSKENVRRHGMATPSCAASTRAQRASSEIFWHLPEKL